MNFNSKLELEKEGFAGFRTIGDLFSDSSMIPDNKGVYLVLLTKKEHIRFVSIGTGGHFKGKDPNVSVNYLKEKWVNDTIVVYIGKAGKDGSSVTMKTRLRQYLGFGRGRNIGHWGGRLIWQIKDHDELVICWKVLEDEDPRLYESTLINQFMARFNKRPYANLID